MCFGCGGANSLGVWNVEGAKASAIGAAPVVANASGRTCCTPRPGVCYHLRRLPIPASPPPHSGQIRKRLRKLDAVKTRLYTNITHEFRTPLTVISGMADQIRENPSEWLDEGVRMIKRNSNRLLDLVNQMLDLAKLESGKMTLHLQPGDVVGYLRWPRGKFPLLRPKQRRANPLPVRCRNIRHAF
ncbi:MAG: HAMP domain-containing histidine kinase [Lewinellaceae bacterium]|nr:HAMP domain-containing histidine kinase [Lewinellaceae bacterium]